MISDDRFWPEAETHLHIDSRYQASASPVEAVTQPGNSKIVT